MLVLSRKAGQTIEIDPKTVGSKITLTVVQVYGDKVIIGFDAPRETIIHRGEVAEAIAKEGTPEPVAGGVDHVA